MARARHKYGGTCLVSFSGGKDSLACLDLACRTFDHVTCFYLYFLPGAEVTEQPLEYARQKFKVPILYYPHWLLWKCLRMGLYCVPNPSYADLAVVNVIAFYNVIRQDTDNTRCIIHGAKRADSVWRRRTMGNRKQGDPDVVYPLEHWKKADVVRYLDQRNITAPDTHAGNATGIGLTHQCILWLYDKHPADYRRLLYYFPYAGAVVERRKMYGLSK